MKFDSGRPVEPPLTPATRLCFFTVHRPDFRPSYLVTHIAILQSNSNVLIVGMPSLLLHAWFFISHSLHSLFLAAKATAWEYCAWPCRLGARRLVQVPLTVAIRRAQVPLTVATWSVAALSDDQGHSPDSG